jgi:hypothetical protein
MAAGASRALVLREGLGGQALPESNYLSSGRVWEGKPSQKATAYLREGLGGQALPEKENLVFQIGS